MTHWYATARGLQPATPVLAHLTRHQFASALGQVGACGVVVILGIVGIGYVARRLRPRSMPTPVSSASASGVSRSQGA